MPAGTVRKWLQRGWETFLDPEKQARVDQLSRHLRASISKKKKKFSLEVAVRDLEFDPDDLRLARESAYRTYVDRALDDAHLTESEQGSLEWVADALHITKKEKGRIHAEAGRKAFGLALAAAVQDGHIDAAESDQIRGLAEWMGLSVANVVSTFFAEEGEGFLRSMFLASTQDGDLLEGEWSRFVQSAERLGFDRQKAIALVRPHAERFIEHVLVDAKADERISKREEANLEWLLNELGMPADFCTYVREEIGEVRLYTDINEGRLPSVTHAIPVELRAGEIVHFFGPAVFQRFKELKSGTKVELFEGDVAITDSRLIFASGEKPFTVNLRRVISVVPEERYVELQATATATGIYQFGERTRLAGLILTMAVRRSNQTVVDKSAGLPDRHIPRDVRQRVYQQYGGRCADCGAEDYLEYDHIIPVAKGGSNGETNIQLLCRRCNLKKSDHI